jgi:hypothetical protein
MKRDRSLLCEGTVFFACLLIFLSSPLRCYAQGVYDLMEETTSQTNMTASFEAAQKDYCAAVVRGGAPSCLVFGPTTFSSAGSYLTFLSFGSFRHYDEGTYTSKGMTPDQARELSARRHPTIAANAESGIALHPEMSYLSQAQGNLALVTDLEIKPGTLSILRDYVQHVELPAAHRAGFLSFELYQVVAGGSTTRYLLIRRFKTFSQLDGVIPFADGGRTGTGARAEAAISQSVEHTKTVVMRVRPDLSAIQ